MDGLPFRELWAADFEFRALPGERPVPVCMVARELRSGRLLRRWQDELPDRPPFEVGPDTLFVAYVAQAELGCFAALGWPAPARILDLFAEFRTATNGRQLPHGRSLLDALSVYGIGGITSAEKTSMRDLVIRGGPWTQTEQAAILAYCQTDVDALGPLLERMLPAILARPKGLGQALLRGRYTAAVAAMEHNGIPVDTDTLGRLRQHWHPIQRDLIREVDRGYGVYDAATFKADRFEAWLRSQGIPWPRTTTGRLQLDRETFRLASNVYPQVAPLHELRTSLSELRIEKLAAGQDGRNRVSLWPFATKTSRNAPSTTQYIFGPARWLRSLIRPEQGRALAYIDWSSQEIGVAAALSGDAALLEAVGSGDPYLRFATIAGLAPAGATKQSHGQVRNLCKTTLLGSLYGMGASSLAQRTGSSLLVAEATHRALARAFPTYWRWAADQVDGAELYGQTRTVFGWTLRVNRDTRPTTLRNFPMQAHGAEMLRLACCLATERGIQVDAPVHDAMLVEAPAAGIDEAVAATRAAMSEAARTVLAGFDIDTEAVVVAWPDRYVDPRGLVMWDRVSTLLDRQAEQPDGQLYVSGPPKPLRARPAAGSGQRRGLTGMTRCLGCGQWLRPRPDPDDYQAAERAYAGDEWQEHDCPADYGHALDLTSDEEWMAWEAAEQERAGQ
jgi:hypothetical protein